MSSNAIDAQGMKIWVSPTGSPQAHVAIPEVRTIGGPSGSSGLNDVTDLDSTGKEWKPQLKDEGEISLGIYYIPDNAVHAGLRTAWSARTKKAFRLEFTDTSGTTWDFEGYVTSFNVTGGVDEVVTAIVTIKITGSITEGV